MIVVGPFVIGRRRARRMPMPMPRQPIVHLVPKRPSYYQQVSAAVFPGPEPVLPSTHYYDYYHPSYDIGGRGSIDTAAMSADEWLLHQDMIARLHRRQEEQQGYMIGGLGALMELSAHKKARRLPLPRGSGGKQSKGGGDWVPKPKPQMAGELDIEDSESKPSSPGSSNGQESPRGQWVWVAGNDANVATAFAGMAQGLNTIQAVSQPVITPSNTTAPEAVAAQHYTTIPASNAIYNIAAMLGSILLDRLAKEIPSVNQTIAQTVPTATPPPPPPQTLVVVGEFDSMLLALNGLMSKFNKPIEDAADAARLEKALEPFTKSKEFLTLLKELNPNIAALHGVTFKDSDLLKFSLIPLAAQVKIGGYSLYTIQADSSRKAEIYEDIRKALTQQVETWNAARKAIQQQNNILEPGKKPGSMIRSPKINPAATFQSQYQQWLQQTNLRDSAAAQSLFNKLTTQYVSPSQYAALSSAQTQQVSNMVSQTISQIIQNNLATMAQNAQIAQVAAETQYSPPPQDNAPVWSPTPQPSIPVWTGPTA
jgi:hypothetical protein